jgi:hypothetical protein
MRVDQISENKVFFGHMMPIDRYSYVLNQRKGVVGVAFESPLTPPSTDS